jgi:hypothetical protein
MVKIKQEKSTRDWLTEHLEEIKENRPVIDTRWFVVEITPAYRTRVGDGHGGSDLEWVSESSKIVSPYFKSKDKAKGWMNKHEPDEGKTLEIKRENLRRRTIDEWVGW